MWSCVAVRHCRVHRSSLASTSIPVRPAPMSGETPRKTKCGSQGARQRRSALQEPAAAMSLPGAKQLSTALPTPAASPLAGGKGPPVGAGMPSPREWVAPVGHSSVCWVTHVHAMVLVDLCSGQETLWSAGGSGLSQDPRVWLCRSLRDFLGTTASIAQLCGCTDTRAFPPSPSPQPQ